MAIHRCGVLDVKLVKRSAPKLTAHNLGETRPDIAVTREEWGNRAVVDLCSRRSAQDVLDECDAIPRAGQKASRRMLLMLGGPPPFEAEDAWPKERVKKWAEDCQRWVKKAIGPDAVVESSTLHVDERSPHIHITVVPAVRDAKGPKLSAKVVQRRMAGLPDKGREVGPRVLAMVQDSFHRLVSSRYGLARMRKDGPRKAEPIDRDKGLRERLADTQRLLEESARRGRQLAAAGAVDRRRLEWSWARVKGRERRVQAQAQAQVRSPGPEKERG